MSTDNTVDILRSVADSEVRIITEPDRGIYDAMNKGLGLAKGDVVGFLHADDKYADDLVLSAVSDSLRRTGATSCYGDLAYISRDSERVVRYWRSRAYSPALFVWGWMPPHPTFFVRREAYERYGGFRLDLGTAADYELMLRFLLKHGISSVYLPKLLVKMRVGGISNRSLVNRWQAHRMDRKAWQVNGLVPRPWTLPMKPLRKIGQYLARP